MKNKINIAITIFLSIVLFFIDINTIALPYLAIVFCYLIYQFMHGKQNEVVLSVSLFGYSFFLLSTKVIGNPNLPTIVAVLGIFFGIKMLLYWQPNGKVSLDNKEIKILVGFFFTFIVFSMADSFMGEYQQLKMQLFWLWSMAYFFSLQTFDNAIINFDFKQFLILSFLLFVPHFAYATSEDGISTLSPYKVWTTYSVLDDGIRGHDFDIISATRIAGLGVLAFLVYLLDFSIKKAYLFLMLMFFIVMIVVCQTRQSIVAIVFPLLFLVLYNFIKNKTNSIGIYIGIILIIASVINYITYLETNNVESRIVSSAEGSSDEGSGRERIWASAYNYITNNSQSAGFGNFKYYAKTHEYPHNIFLEVYIEIGIIGTLLLSIIVFLMFFDLYKLLLSKSINSKLEIFLLLSALYYFGMAQFSADLPRNMTFFYLYALYKVLLLNKDLKTKSQPIEVLENE